ncbi:glutamine amidotransferase [Thiohalomonas denitrificans]|uniref:GMP synthase (Glutamine-hydrolysing) n=1 Tax=Thiohalomonas denitrificans TaxID=415747 RepID=A0A1G5QVP3_9GAMM|nr:glutamine amidotransferase [Thiohalomonas denitrificans]SCZ65610.1 GMP synthase (glutamine-hydrolysing) [Thiohalomonas denitrificans]
MNTSSAPPQVTVVRHMAFEDLGVFADVFRTRGLIPSTIDAGVDDLAPLEEADLAVVLGGPIGVYETDRYPFLKQELSLLEKRLAAGRPTLGICLGAQLIVRALGGRVYPGGSKEIGWGSVRLTEAGKHSCLAAIETQPVLHWHGDTFDCPTGAQLLAGTELYPNQAFSYGSNVLALQFHAEADSRRIEQWLIGHTSELTTADIDVPTLREASQVHGEGLRAAGRKLLSDWLDQIEW